MLAAGVTFEQPRGFYATARVRYFDERALEESGSGMSGSSLVFNGGFGWRAANLELRVDVLNLFDRLEDEITYLHASRLPGEAPEGVMDRHLHPLEPRSVRAYAVWKF